MLDIKPWYQSKAVWGSLITLVSMVATLAGQPINPADQQSLVTLTTALAGSAGAMLSLVGRLVADSRIGK